MVSTLDAAAPLQSDAQVTLARRLNQVVRVMSPGSNVDALVPSISVNPDTSLVVDCCHLYSKVPLRPDAPDWLVIIAGLNGIHPV